MATTENYFQKSIPGFQLSRSNAITSYNPATPVEHTDAVEIKVEVYDYNADEVNHLEFNGVHDCKKFRDNGHITWINVDGIRKDDVELICREYDIHPLLVEDVLSVGQRPKMDEMENVLFCLL